MMYRYAYLTRQSLSHSANQDAVKIFNSKQNNLLVVVCDGVSGSNGGEVASETVTYRLVKSFEKLIIPNDYDLDFLKHWFEETIISAKEDMNIEAKINPAIKDMATTICAAIFIGHNMYVFNIGDSRAYLINQLDIKQITRDHNYENYCKDKNMQMDEKLKNAKESLVNFISTNMSKRLSFDAFYNQLHDGDIIMICTDGIYKFAPITYNEIIQKQPSSACNYIMNKALINKTNDDATLALIYYGEGKEH